jgi:rRNA processing protein Gar1
MFKLLRRPGIVKPLTWLLMFSFLAMTNSCYYFRVNKSAEPPATAITKMQDAQKLIIIHLDDKIWQLSDIIVKKDSITGRIGNIFGHETYKRVKPDQANRYKKNESQVLNEVHIYTTEFAKAGAAEISIPLKAITKIDVFDKASGATIASWLFSGLAIGVGAFGVFLIILLLTKSSCPFIYTFNGKDYILTGEIFSGATQPGLERDDYLPLPSYASADRSCKLKISNEVHEIQSVNLTELLVIDHPQNTSVLIDKNGIPYSFQKPVSPAAARSIANTDILPILANKDTLVYTGSEKEIGKNGIDEIVMKFVRPLNSESGRLIIRAKNSFWFDALISKIQGLFGERYNNYALKESKTPGDELRKWQLEQKMPLSVSIEKDGKWQSAGYFNIAGPIAMRDEIMSLDLKGIKSDTVKLKLETGFLFWEIDYAAMDFGRSEVMNPVSVPLKTAIDNNNLDISRLLLKSDSSYYVQKQTGDEAVLTFDTPEQTAGKRTVFLHSRGYYKILREQTGKADKKKLKTFRKPGMVPAYSKETFDLLPGK